MNIIEQAEARGFVKGVKFNSAGSGNLICYLNSPLDLYFMDGWMSVKPRRDAGCIYKKKGNVEQWAEIISTEE